MSKVYIPPARSQRLRAPDRGVEPVATVRFEGCLKQAMETGRTRLMLAAMVFALAFATVGGRLVTLSISTEGNEPSLAQVATPERLETARGDIVDRNGVVLATTLPTASLYANPRQVRNPDAAARRLHEVLPDIAAEAIASKLKLDRSFVWLKRSLTPREQQAINRLGVPGFYFQREHRRYYPQQELAPHVVGFTSVDNEGLAGMERAFDDLLRGSPEPLSLSLDARVQHIVNQELAGAMKEFGAVGAAGVVMDARTGEVLALSSLPRFDPHRAGEAEAEARFNRATLGIYEMGSVFKIFTTAMVLDRDVLAISDGFDTSRPIRAAGFTIRDFKPKNRWMSVPEIFMYSSNIGTVQMALSAGTKTQRDFLADLGLLTPASVEVDEVGRPLVPSPWREINTMTIAYGHGLAVSPLQVATAVSAMVNGGELVSPTLIERAPGETIPGRRVIDRTTSQQMRDLLRLVVLNGTGGKADAEGYRVGGKTGTADKLVNGTYARNKRIASFAGAFPMDDPRFVIFVMVDEPKPTAKTHGYATGGWVAAPVMRKIVERVAPLYGLEPAKPEEAVDPAEGLLLQAKVQG